jgi:nucleotide-binding universal stress UspA family protein
MARAEKPEPAAITILHVLPPGYARADEIRASHAIHESMEGVPGIEEVQITTQIVEGDDPYSKIIEASEGQDLIVIGASEEPLFRNFLVGTGPERVARNADVTVMMVKRRRSPLHSFMREAILEPTKPKPLE